MNKMQINKSNTTTAKKASNDSNKNKKEKSVENKSRDSSHENNGSMDVDGCLSNLSFVCSGVFESISRDKLEEIIKNNGGRIVTAVSGKTDYLVVGY